MPNSYTSLRYHVTFSTKDRFPWISEDWNTDLYRYIGGIVRGQKGKLIEIGGQVLRPTLNESVSHFKLELSHFIRE
jgi:hypothetical protein